MVEKVTIKDLSKIATGVAVGTTIEWYDFSIASVISATIFPYILFPSTMPKTIAIIFGILIGLVVGLFARPVGSFVWGHIGDRWGRKPAVIIDFVATALSAVALGLTPTYQQVGYLAPSLAVVFRFLTGLGIGGIWGGASAWLTETAYAVGSRWRALWASWTQIGLPLGLIWAPGMMAILSTIYPGKSFLTFGWRVAYFVAAAAVVVAAFMWFFVTESTLFKYVRDRGMVAKAPSLEVFRYHWKEIIILFFAFIGNPALGYLFIAYSPAYISGVGLPMSFAYETQSIASLVGIFILIIFALLSDKYGRKPIFFWTYVALIPYSFIYPLLIITRVYAYALLAQIIFWGILIIANMAMVPALFSEHFPTRFRYSGAGVTYNLTVATGGSVAALLATTLIGTEYVAKWWILSIIIFIFVLVSTLVTFFLLSETKEKRLE